MNSDIIDQIYIRLSKRKIIDEKISYTSKLLINSDLLAKKIGEESTELVIDFIKNNKEGVITESADLLYHIIVCWLSSGVNPEDVWKELSNRTKLSGIEEKENRKKSKIEKNL